MKTQRIQIFAITNIRGMPLRGSDKKLRLFRGNLRRVCEKRHVTAVLIINTLIYSAQRRSSGRAKRRYEQRIFFSQLKSTYLFSHAARRV